MTTLMAWVDGDLFPLAEARVSVLDQGFRTGEGVFETLRSYGTHPFRLDAHLARAAAGAHRLGFDTPTRDDLATAVHATIAANAGTAENLAVRLTCTPGPLDPDGAWVPLALGTPTVVVTAHGLALPPGLYRDGVAALRVGGVRSLAEVKSVSWAATSVARRHAAAAGADEALLTDPDGTILEGASTNVFLVVDGALVTPPLDGSLLPGVTRQTVLELAPALGLAVREVPLTVTQVAAAQEAFLTASTREVVPLVEIDRNPVGDGRPGPVTAAVLAAYRECVAAEHHG